MSSIVFALHNHLKSLIGRHWSRTHGFFIVMGGFHLFKRVPEEQNDSQSISQENDDLLHPLLAVDLVRDDFYSFTMLTEAKIKDWRKSDWLARLAFGENPDGLEAIFNFIAGFQDNDFDPRRDDRVPRFGANSTKNDFMIADLIMLGVGICFGVIYCIAWGFPFLTHMELLIWRTLSVAITVVPFYIPLVIILATWLFNMDKFAANIISVIIVVSFFSACILYIVNL